jgi:putative spermidine/putrescine transport system substrate-binding protein
MNKISLKLLTNFLFTVFSISVASTSVSASDEWNEVLESAKGTTVNFHMWSGDDRINTYIDDWIGSRMLSEHGVILNRVPLSDTVEGINTILGERQAGRKTGGSVDALWVNGENFKTGKQADIWECGYNAVLPNNQYVNWDTAAIAFDYGTPVDDCETPYGFAQFAMIYDTERVNNTPDSMSSLLAWIKENPGKFTYPAPPDFTGSLFIRHLVFHVAGGFDAKLLAFEQARFDALAPKIWTILNDIEGSLWRGGETYPASVAALHDLFANREIDITMTDVPGTAAGLVERGTFPGSTSTFVFEEGTLGNTSYIGIPNNAANSAGAKILANLLLSPEAQAEKANPAVWGYDPAIDITLVGEASSLFDAIPTHPALDPIRDRGSKVLPELAADWNTALEEGWRKFVLEN